MLLFMHLFDSFSILKKSSEPMQQPNHDMNPFSFFIYNLRLGRDGRLCHVSHVTHVI